MIKSNKSGVKQAITFIYGTPALCKAYEGLRRVKKMLRPSGGMLRLRRKKGKDKNDGAFDLLSFNPVHPA
ncbi:MAG: hypothetical protein GY765_39085 [bacterium]|nr:hypothetical protein [bacterium]